MLKQSLLVLALTFATGVAVGFAPEPAAEIGAIQLSASGVVRPGDLTPVPGAPGQLLAQN